MKFSKRIVCLMALLLSGLGGSARADNTVCTGAIFVIPDGSLHQAVLAPDQDRWFRFVAEPNRSYALLSENLDLTDSLGFVGMASPIAPDCAGSDLPNAIPETVSPASTDPLGTVGSVRRTFVAATETNVFFRVRSTAAGNIRIRVEETTIFSPAWTTNGTFETFYSLQNTTNRDINGTLTLYSLVGTVVDTITAVIPNRGTLSTNTSAMATSRSQTGVAVFTHDGPPGAILCEVAIANYTTSVPYVQAVKCQTARQQR